LERIGIDIESFDSMRCRPNPFFRTERRRSLYLGKARTFPAVGIALLSSRRIKTYSTIPTNSQVSFYHFTSLRAMKHSRWWI